MLSINISEGSNVILNNWDDSLLSGSRIVIVLGTLEMGGTERQALYLAKYLKKAKGAKVYVFGMSGPGAVAAGCDELGIPWKIIPFRWPCRKSTFIKTFPRFAWHLIKARPDVVLAYNHWANVACGLTWRMTRAQTCIWNQRDLDEEGLTGHRVEKWASKLTNGFISNSNCAADFLCKTLGVNREWIRVVHNGVWLNKRKSRRTEWRTKLGVSKNCLLVCMVANLRYPKDHGTLVRAWRHVIDNLDKENHSAVLLFAGLFQDTYNSIKALVDNLRLDDHVHFLGQVEDVYDLLSVVDLCVFSSLSESSPNGILESMASGLGVVATDIPGIREAVGPDGYRYLVPANDVEALAERILELLKNSELRLIVGAKNLRRIDEEFSLEKMLTHTFKIINGQLTVSKNCSFASQAAI